MAAKPDGVSRAPQLLITWENISAPSKQGTLDDLFKKPLPLASREITVLETHRFFQDLPRIDTEKAKYLFQQILGNVFHKDCRQEHSDLQNVLSFQIAPDSLYPTLRDIEEIIRRVGLRSERLIPDLFYLLTLGSEKLREDLMRNWAREAEKEAI